MSAAYMRFWVGDFLKNTGHLSTAEVGAYTLLILFYFEMGALPDDDARLARITRLNMRNWLRMRPTIEAFFEPGWVHSKVEEEITVSRGKSATKSANAKGKGRPRRQNGDLYEAPNMIPRDDADICLTSGESFEKTAADLCDRIAVAVQSLNDRTHMSESESESKIPDAADAHAKRPTDEEIYRAMLGAGVSTEIMGPAMDRDFRVFYQLMHAGIDFHATIVPSVRAQMARRKSRQAIGTWDFFRPGILEYHRQALAASAEIAEAVIAGPLVSAPVRVKHCLPVNWEPSPEDTAFGKNCGLRVEELNGIRDEMRSWATRTGTERDDWADLFRRKAQQKASALGRKSAAEQAAHEERQRQAHEALSARIAELSRSA